MTHSAPAVTVDSKPGTLSLSSGRADATRQLLLQSARRRFAMDGYRTTTVRDIAADAGVNVALINRYFESKEGLFEACLAHAAEHVHHPSDGTLDQAIQTVSDRVAASPAGEESLHLVLLLRTSGDDRADAIRRKTLRTFAERIAVLAGWTPGEGDDDDLLLRAEVAIAMSLGIALLRTSGGLEPLTSSTPEKLTGAIGDAFSALLVRRV